MFSLALGGLGSAFSSFSSVLGGLGTAVSLKDTVSNLLGKVTGSSSTKATSSTSSSSSSQTTSNIMNLNVSDADVMSQAMAKLTDPNASPMETSMIQYALSKRMELASLISNVMKTISDTSKSIIANMR